MSRHLDEIGREIAESLYDLPVSQQFETIKELMESLLVHLQWHQESTERDARPAQSDK